MPTPSGAEKTDPRQWQNNQPYFCHVVFDFERALGLLARSRFGRTSNFVIAQFTQFYRAASRYAIVAP